MWYERSRVTVVGTASISTRLALDKLREKFLALGGTLETELEDTIIGSTRAHMILGKSYLLGAWYGKVPFRLRLRVTSGTQGGTSKIHIDCDLTAILIRFVYVFTGLSIFVILPIAIRGWRQDPSLLFVLLFPLIICLGNYLSLRMVLPQKLRRAFQLDALWWDA